MPNLNKLIESFYEPVEVSIENNIQNKKSQTKDNIIELFNQFILNALPNLSKETLLKNIELILENKEIDPKEKIKDLIGDKKWGTMKHYVGIIQAEIDWH